MTKQEWAFTKKINFRDKVELTMELSERSEPQLVLGSADMALKERGMCLRFATGVSLTTLVLMYRFYTG